MTKRFLCSAAAMVMAGILQAEPAPDAAKPETKPAAPGKRVEKPKMVSAKEWGSTPKQFAPEYNHTPRVILIHHAGVEWKEGQDAFKSVKSLQTWGQAEKNWVDVPYHFQIAPDGTIFEGRELKYRPDTNTSFDTSGYINIEFMGNFEVQRASEAQLKSAVVISNWLVHEFNMEPQDIVTHKDVAQTACPGKDLYQYFHTGPFEEWVEAAMGGKEVKIELLPPLVDGPAKMIPGTQENWIGKVEK